MKWIEIDKQTPLHGSLVWVWDMNNSYKLLIRYMGSQEVWFQTKGSAQFPIWAPLNDDDDISQ